MYNIEASKLFTKININIHISAIIINLIWHNNKIFHQTITTSLHPKQILYHEND